MATKVLITGATGLVGKKLTKLLVAKDYTVHVLTTQKALTSTATDIQYFYWNPQDNHIDLSCFQGVKVVINLAGSPIAQRWTTAAKSSILKSRVQALNVLANAIKNEKIPVKHLISASAIGIYPDSKTNYYEEPDTASENSSFLRTVVQQWETAAHQFESLGVQTAILRIGIVLDTEGGALPKLLAPIKKYLGAVLASGEQWQSWIHIDDLAAMFVHAIESKLKGVYNAVAPNPVQQSELTKTIGHNIKKPIVLPNVPEFMLKLILGGMSAVVLESQRVCSKKIQSTGFKFDYHELSVALNNLLKP